MLMFNKKKDIDEDKKNEEEKVVDEEIDDSNVREIIVERRSGFNFSEVIIIMIIAIMFGFLLGNIVNFVVFNDNSSSDELDELVTTYNNIIDNYYEDVDKEELIDAGIQGMINYLDDPYATYFSGDASDDFNEELDGTYTFISDQTFPSIDVIKSNMNLKVILKKHENDEGINPHQVNPNYLKKTEAEENLTK